MRSAASKSNEADEQEVLFQYLDLLKIPAFAIPNGGRRNPGEAAHMKRCGVKPGVPDIFIPVPTEKYHGLFVEMKAKHGGRLSNLQHEWIHRLRECGYDARVCFGADEAIRVITEYLEVG